MKYELPDAVRVEADGPLRTPACVAPNSSTR